MEDFIVGWANSSSHSKCNRWYFHQSELELWESCSETFSLLTRGHVEKCLEPLNLSKYLYWKGLVKRSGDLKPHLLNLPLNARTERFL